MADNFFDEDDIKEEEVSKEEVDISKTESGLRGAAQGLSFDFADEIQAAAEAMGADAVEVYEAITGQGKPGPAPKYDEFNRPILPESDGGVYREKLKRIRDEYKAAREANPKTYLASEIGAGIAPALLTGGATAAGRVGASLGKEAIKQTAKKGLGEAVKKSAKVGAGYGALSGLGVSEADLTKGELGQAAKDVAVGATLGAGLGTAFPIAGKAVVETGRTAKNIGGFLADKMPSLKTGFKFGEEYGLASSKKINNIMEDRTRDLIKVMQTNFQKLGLDKKAAEKKAMEAGKTYDLTGDIREIAQVFKEKTKGLLPADAAKAAKMAQDFEEGFLRVDVQKQKLLEQVNKEIQKKVEKSANVQKKSIIKGEEKAVLEAEKEGVSLEQLEDINKRFEDVSELPYDTVGGKIGGQKAKFKGEYMDIETGEMVPYSYDKKYLQGTTPFKPSEISTGQVDDKLYAQYADEATGEMFTKSLPASRFAEQDFSKLTVDEIIELIPVYGQKAFEEGGDNVGVYKELYKMLRNKMPEIADELPQNKQEMYKLYQTMDILGMDKSRLLNPSVEDVTKLVKKLPGKMDVEKDIIERNLLKQDSDLSRGLEDVKLVADAKKYLGGTDSSTTQEFTRAGVLQRVAASGADVAGAGYGMIKKPYQKVANNVSRVSAEGLNYVNKVLNSSDQSALQAMGRQLDEALQQEDSVKSALMWSLSQNPAFRQQLGKILPEMDKEMSETLGEDVRSPLNEFLDEGSTETPLMLEGVETAPEDDGFFEDSDIDRDPASMDTIKENEGYREHKYKDIVGKDTIGYGHLISKEEMASGMIHGQDFTDGLSREEAEIVATKDKEINDANLGRTLESSGIEGLSEKQMEGMSEAAYQLGGEFLNKFPAMKQALKDGDFDAAAKHAMSGNSKGSSSDWLRQTPKRVKDFVQRIDDDFTVEDAKEFNKLNKRDKFDFSKQELEDLVEKAKKAIDGQVRQQGAGNITPEDHIDKTLGAIDALPTDQINIDALQDEAVNMQTYSDADRLKKLLDGLKIG